MRIKRSVFETVCIFFVICISAAFVYFKIENSTLIIPVAAIVLLTCLASQIAPAKFGKVSSFCFQYRWALALTVFLICTAMKLSGSSIGMYNEYLPTKISDVNSTLFGKALPIRSDEWAVQTPTFFSQKYNGYNIHSSRMSLSETNMVMDYFAPVWDITVIGKPLSWGYLLFGNTIGLSWYWCGQLMLLFMLSLELFLIITDDSRMMSIAGALMITLSPNIQWWFLPHMPIVIMYAEGLFVIGYHFFTVREERHRAFLSTASVSAVVGFGLSIFPSFQVPCLYIVTALIIACLYRDKNRITFTRKKWYTIFIPVVTVTLILTHFYTTSWEAIEAVLNSVYPGKRMCCGGDRNISSLFTNLSSLTLPYRDITYDNNCEVSDYIHFAPFIVALAPRMFIRLKKDRKSIAVGAVLLAGTILTGLYMVVGVPQWLASITLLRFCNRMNGIYSWCATIFTVWGLNLLLRYPDLLKKWQKLLYPVFYTVICIAVAEERVIQYLSTLSRVGGNGLIAAVLLAAGLSCILMATFFAGKKFMCALISAVMVLCGATVNPIECGTGAITNHPVYPEIYDIAHNEPDALWLSCDLSFVLSNYLIACGARCIDATNFYSDTGKWNIIDPEGQYEEYTNRYSNQTAQIVTEHDYVELPTPDQIRFSITPETVKSLGVRYLFSQQDYTSLFSEYGIFCKFVTGQDGYNIYKLEY